ncbi:MAG: hypothetical protein K2Y05_00170, partial [Hyphomicrobiaceae bacterium]|nr:hypothetical protein [Hyphomicrobiaceae bacterium]
MTNELRREPRTLTVVVAAAGTLMIALPQSAMAQAAYRDAIGELLKRSDQPAPPATMAPAKPGTAATAQQPSSNQPAQSPAAPPPDPRDG